ncbi:MAG: hypothetical protein FJ033_02065 [Chloroflexi bacterium]|nr:hypothetical protein [Chloroflexota bacterium]
MNDTWYHLAHEATRRSSEILRAAAVARAAREPGAPGLRATLADAFVALAARLDARCGSSAARPPVARYA